MESSSQTSHRPAALLRVAFILGLLLLSVLLVAPTRSMVAALATADQQLTAQIDRLLTESAPDGDILVHCAGEEVRPLLPPLYYRGNYVLHPRRLYVSRPSQVINGEPTMLFPTDVAPVDLAREIGATWLFRCRQRDDGAVDYSFERVAP